MTDRPPPPMPERHEPPAARSRGSLVSVVMALAAGTAITVVLALLTFNTFGVMVLVAGGLFVFIGLQYLVWGWWLGRMLRDEAESDDDDRTT